MLKPFRYNLHQQKKNIFEISAHERLIPWNLESVRSTLRQLVLVSIVCQFLAVFAYIFPFWGINFRQTLCRTFPQTLLEFEQIQILSSVLCAENQKSKNSNSPENHRRKYSCRGYL